MRAPVKKTLNITGFDTYVKENYNLSRELVTVYTQVSSDPEIKLHPEFVFKGKGTRTTLNPPQGTHFQWAPKGHIELNICSKQSQTFRTYKSRGPCVHIMPEVKAALLKQGYVLVVIGGGVTGDIQVNDTDVHSPLKGHYRTLKQELMMDHLRLYPTKIPQPSRDDMMRMLDDSFKALDIDFASRFKALWVTNALDGSEDYLVSERIYWLENNWLLFETS